MRIRSSTAKLGGFGTLKTRSRIEALHLTNFEKLSRQPPRKALSSAQIQILNVL